MKTLKALLTVAVICSAVYVGIKVVPAYFNYYQFQDAVAGEARMGTYDTKSVEDIQASILKKAQDLDVPLSAPEQIKVDRSGPAGSTVSITTEYTVHIDVPVHPFDLKFQINSRNKQAF